MLNSEEIERFWARINTASKGGQLDLRRLKHSLRGIDRRSLKQFNRTLGHLLYELDRQELYDFYEGASGSPMVDPDGFLYWRAGIVAAGKEAFEAVFNVKRDISLARVPECEELLYVGDEAAYDDLGYGVDIETGSNYAFWNALPWISPKSTASLSEDEEHWRLYWISLRVEDLTLEPLPDEEQALDDVVLYPAAEVILDSAQRAETFVAGKLTEGLAEEELPSFEVHLLIQLTGENRPPFPDTVHTFDTTLTVDGFRSFLVQKEVVKLAPAEMRQVFAQAILEAVTLSFPTISTIRGRAEKLRKKLGTFIFSE
ncbi:MAG: hypothetical protein DI611_12930 [Brachybacterium faecium]|uniref:DUF4240 domain-containing protein n=1 Tax=Brachybacterium muris TaxID=219301 RepID=UPI000DB40BA7|nr:DUF4240 domain-containing protein [Brachybacterium muris]PZP14047.1 MAG: hypothetical protein DI611_12930 [Brachybacterium faecium]